MRQKYLLVFVFFVALGLSVFATTPDWCDEQWRNDNYPHNTYYVGYASYMKSASETKNKAISKSKEDAFHQLTQQITVNISSATKNAITAVSSNGSYDEAEIFEQVSSVTSHAKVSNAKIESYYDVQTSAAHTLVFVSKEELIDTYRKEYDLAIAKIGGSFESASAMIQRNEKSIAQSECDTIMNYLPKMEDCIRMLVVIDSSFAYDEALQAYSEYRLVVQELKSQLEQSIQLYIVIDDSVSEKYKSLLYGELLSKITGNSCSICEAKDNANYVISLSPALRKSSNDGDIQYVFADVDVSLYNTYKKSTIFTNSYSAKGAGPSEDKANRKAIIKSTSMIATDLIKKIK